MLNPRTGRFMQRDPAGYVDGMNQYAAFHVMHSTVDPMGLQEQKRCKVSSFEVLPFDTWFEDQGGWLLLPFYVSIEFEEDGCNCCEYRQYVRGFGKRDGKKLEEPDTPTGKVNEETFIEDTAWGHEFFPGGERQKVRRGHRSDHGSHLDRYTVKKREDPENPPENEEFDRKNGRFYYGYDEPGIRLLDETKTAEYFLEFRLVVIDTCNKDEHEVPLEVKVVKHQLHIE